jgi:hypothetical protein
LKLCSLFAWLISQQYFSLRTSLFAWLISQQYFSLRTNQQPASSTFLSKQISASHQPNEQALALCCVRPDGSVLKALSLKAGPGQSQQFSHSNSFIAYDSHKLRYCIKLLFKYSKV